MSMLPAIFGENLFDEFFNDPFDRMFTGRNPLYGKHEKAIMRTDVRDTGSAYELDIDLPGFKKDEVQAKLEDGYLTVTAQKGLDKDQKDKEGNYIRRERYAGSCSRTFYVGDGVQQSDVTAKFEDGILRLTVPKKDVPQVQQNNYIAIE